MSYSALENPKPSELSLDATDIVDFQLEQIVVGNSAKSVLFWTEEFRRNILGHGHTRYTEQELQEFMGLVQTHYTPHFDIFQGNTSLQDWLNDLKVWVITASIDRAGGSCSTRAEPGFRENRSVQRGYPG